MTSTPRPVRSSALARRTTAVPDRAFDTTELDLAAVPYIVHRDYAAHYFKYGFIARRSWQRRILDVGCGSRMPLARVISFTQATPELYVGTDYGAISSPIGHRWAVALEHVDMTDPTQIHDVQLEFGKFSLVVCLEVIEHMPQDAGRRLLEGLRELTADDGEVVLSTPVFDGHMAANHIHEYEISELQTLVEQTGFQVLDRFGTFMSYNDVRRALSDLPEVLQLYERIREFYDDEVMANWLAPAFPELSRNNVWVLGHSTPRSPAGTADPGCGP